MSMYIVRYTVLFFLSICWFSTSSFAQNTVKKNKFKSIDQGFGSYLALFPTLELPADFPPGPVLKNSAMKNPINSTAMARFVCGSKFFSCKLKEEHQEAFALGRVPVSETTVALVVLVQGKIDNPVLLLTYGTNGNILGGAIVGGGIGDFDYGYTGQLATDGVSLSVNRYVWVNAQKKEYVKNSNFKISPMGDLTFVINPSEGP